MAKVNLTLPFAEIHGSIGKDKIINRQKKYRDERGRVIHEGIQEAYAVKHPDPQAPIDPLTGSGKRYSQFPAFLRAIIYHTLKSAE